MIRLLFFLFLLVANPGQARADLTAVYRSLDGNSTIRVEVADNGNARFEFSEEPWQLIHVGGDSFGVYHLPDGPLVARVSDIRTFAVEQRSPLPEPSFARSRLVEGDETVVGDYSGRAYFLRLPEGMPSRPQFVITRHPRLMPIGAVWARQIELTIALLRARGIPVPEVALNVRDILAEGTPALYAGHELREVSTDPIPADRFRLPGEPLSSEEIRDRILRPVIRSK